ncbi:dual specificity protein phosphatase 12 [Stylonychia lemnae]|uniref:protein-tyrosine-phosphatase n=1 Tax=Stylonychia lemnae TaxID=5949 RepID=A0A078AHC5_STYLE|nr:dual specificity protein phosphatase 12 [Stylonychia lemnae]|eukprot:CDW81690.1 dual specificity protein phosphatase 12 [Stylonychia lemnae]
MSLILPRLYLGDIEIAESLDTLKDMKVTHILCTTCTIDDKYPDVFYPQILQLFFMQDFKYMVLKLQDRFHENLLLHFDSALDFIKEALQNNGTILSLSAYLIREHGHDFQSAYDFVLSKRPCVQPNPGFMNQLKYYEKDLKELREKSLSQQEEVKQQVPDSILDLLSKPQAPLQIPTDQLPQHIKTTQIQEELKQESEPESKQYSCKKCRKVLFTQDNVEEHISKVKNHNVRRGERIAAVDECSSIFIQQLEWIALDEESQTGKISCPKCNDKLGSYSVYGSQCSCGKWNAPAYQIHKSKVDELTKFTF